MRPAIRCYLYIDPEGSSYIGSSVYEVIIVDLTQSRRYAFAPFSPGVENSAISRPPNPTVYKEEERRRHPVRLTVTCAQSFYRLFSSVKLDIWHAHDTYMQTREAPMANRTTHRSSSGKKLYAVRDKLGRFKDIQTYKRAHGQDIKRKSKNEK